ncbi:hypothetical protein [Streptomyces sp. Inha503]|uniref:hypothetical protein n=1 Tax=Streptomyces sp. Inha503 TaxID=3383314 RepID=UPI0039A00289
MNGTTDVFAIPLEDGAQLAYAPLHGVAFAATKGLVAALSDVLAGEGGDDGMVALVTAGARAVCLPPERPRRW